MSMEFHMVLFTCFNNMGQTISIKWMFSITVVTGYMQCSIKTYSNALYFKLNVSSNSRLHVPYHSFNIQILILISNPAAPAPPHSTKKQNRLTYFLVLWQLCFPVEVHIIILIRRVTGSKVKAGMTLWHFTVRIWVIACWFWPNLDWVWIWIHYENKLKSKER